MTEPNSPRPVQPVPGHVLSHLGVGVLKALSKLPLPILRAVGNALGTLAWWVVWPRRRVTLINLALCFPQMSQRERKRIGHRHFQWFICSILERFIFWTGPVDRIRALVTIENESLFTEHRGKPLILLAPHFVGIDGCGMRLAINSPYCAIYQHQKDPVLDAQMLAGRTRFPGAVVLSRQEGVRSTVRLIRSGVPLHYSPDFDVGIRDAIFVPFFGVPAATVTSMARLAQLTGATVVPWVSQMTRHGYVGRFYPPWADFPGDDIEAATRRLNAFVEERVLEMPEQYMWSHRRFKTRPPGVPSPYSHER